MKREHYCLMERYMRACMGDSAHDQEHIYRVLYTALDIAAHERGVDREVLIAACLLHDVGRQEQFADPSLCHAAVGAEKAARFLTEHGFSEGWARRVAACIRTHRFRTDCRPESLEAKILFDADKLDVTGAMGVARTLLYQGEIGEPIYTLTETGEIDDGAGDAAPSFFREYRHKLAGLVRLLYTERGRELARRRQPAADAFYESLLREAVEPRRAGARLLEENLE